MQTPKWGDGTFSQVSSTFQLGDCNPAAKEPVFRLVRRATVVRYAWLVLQTVMSPGSIMRRKRLVAAA